MSEFEKINALGDDSSSEYWNPTFGEETESLLSRIFGSDEDAKEKVKEETHHIMQLCGNPELEANNDTGLVFGYVQSGKTLSFTTLTALARDNGYQLVIVIAGISTNLVNQSFQRLQNDLNVNQGFLRKWVMLNNPQDPYKNPQDKNTIKRELDSWRNNDTPEHLKKTLLITVMKNTNHLRNLIAVLQQLDLSNVPTLIIDDEGDQASMNTRASANAKREANGEILTELEMSTIYRRIREIKTILPHHTFIQYTATPQAPLFINIMDNLSPNFIQLLTPGEKYTGGMAFFKEHHYIVRNIPYSEIYTEDNPITDIPDSLAEAMRIFFLGVAAGIRIGGVSGNPRNRTMMVHPSRLVDDHGTYHNWVNNAKGQWAKILIERDDNDASKIQLIDEFWTAYSDLNANIKNLPSFEELLQDLGHYIRGTAVEELNSKAGSSVDWNSNYSFILVGGQAMDRGFTVEGLTVTYMPRSKGVGNADTIQQRARFFGYKKDYLGFCRVYLDAENAHLFSEYVDHEEDIRNKLQSHKLSGNHLNDLKRQFVLDEMFKLTRKNVLSDELERNKFGNAWLRIKAPHDTDFIIEQNKTVYNQFLEKYTDVFQDDSGHEKRTEEQKHLIAKISLKDVYEDLISKLKYTRQSDSSSFTSLKAVIALYTDEFPPEESFVYLIKKGASRKRSLNKKDEILNLFQGKNPRTGEVIYPGDDKIKEENHVSVQIHNLELKDTDYKDIVSIAIWIPERLSKSLIKIKDK
ncbi:Z1 domain-containing protein [Echinicola vietnamensis]|uniref:Z1 domain-containing protein n=1 Tax=Echinicola vietnamensis (strain DSM 17526 / LMG 23754 / KMM 6221) TaxID=926556 RepID=L0G030_ECHVK|nr:Z1 domain-containing protein [Echinicola vietnamensis]AGA78235.1 Z1 domain-containing protein [Echinicola vietnamensis DSM 17526]